MIVADVSGNIAIALKTQNNAHVPSSPLTKSNILFVPQGETFAFFSIALVIKRLITALEKTISATGNRPFRNFMHTVIRLNDNALANKAQIAFFVSNSSRSPDLLVEAIGLFLSFSFKFESLILSTVFLDMTIPLPKKVLFRRSS